MFYFYDCRTHLEKYRFCVQWIDVYKRQMLGIYETTAQQNMTPYAVPQECGNRTGVRWAEVTDENGLGMRFSSEDGMNVSVLPYTPREGENARHAYELPPVTKTVVRCTIGQMGVGGDNSWGAKPHPEHLCRLAPGQTFLRCV